MTKATKAQKRRAFRIQDRFLYGLAASGPAAGAALLIPGAGPAVSIGILALGSALSVAGIRMGKLGRDPARDDFEQETVLGPQLYDLDLLRARVGEGPLLNLVEVEQEIARRSDALVIAIERASGAELAERGEIREQREEEAYRLAMELGLRLEVSSDRIGAVRAELTRFAGVSFDRPPLPATMAELLGPDLAAELERIGVPYDQLAAAITSFGEDPVGEFSMSLGAIAESSYEFGTAMLEAAQSNDLLEPGEDETIADSEGEGEGEGEGQEEGEGEGETLA